MSVTFATGDKVDDGPDGSWTAWYEPDEGLHKTEWFRSTWGVGWTFFEVYNSPYWLFRDGWVSVYCNPTETELRVEFWEEVDEDTMEDIVEAIGTSVTQVTAIIRYPTWREYIYRVTWTGSEAEVTLQ
jgi:hypothetical protein